MSRRKPFAWMEYGTLQERRKIADLGRKAMRLKRQAADAQYERATLIRAIMDRIRYQDRAKDGAAQTHEDRLIAIMKGGP